MKKEEAKRVAIGMAVYCMRNTFLEDLHAGTAPSSKAGDYSDVKAVSPYGEIPWRQLSRFNDDEMRTLMKEVVNKLYTVLLRMDDPQFMDGLRRWGQLQARNWDEPEDLKAEAQLWTDTP
jgi:hypothetical protein